MIPKMQKDLDRQLERLDYLNSKASSVPSTTNENERVQTSTENKSMIMADAAIDLERELKQDLRKLNRAKLEANQFIRRSNLTRIEKELMTYRYVKCLHWIDVSDILNYDPSVVQRKHKVIMKKLFR